MTMPRSSRKLSPFRRCNGLADLLEGLGRLVRASGRNERQLSAQLGRARQEISRCRREISRLKSKLHTRKMAARRPSVRRTSPQPEEKRPTDPPAQPAAAEADPPIRRSKTPVDTGWTTVSRGRKPKRGRRPKASQPETPTGCFDDNRFSSLLVLSRADTQRSGSTSDTESTTSGSPASPPAKRARPGNGLADRESADDTMSGSRNESTDRHEAVEAARSPSPRAAKRCSPRRKQHQQHASDKKVERAMTADQIARKCKWFATHRPVDIGTARKMGHERCAACADPLVEHDGAVVCTLDSFSGGGGGCGFVVCAGRGLWAIRSTGVGWRRWAAAGGTRGGVG